MSTVSPTAGATPAGFVPEQLPPLRTDVPRTARTVGGLLALPGMFLLWITPKRFGASLAAAGWHAAIAAHLFALLLGVGMIVWAETKGGQTAVMSLWGHEAARWAPVSLSEWLRAPLVALALECRECSAQPNGMLHIGLGILTLHAALFIIAGSLMPFAGAGERTRHLFGRCMRLTLWSTTALLILGVGWLFEGQMRKLVGLPLHDEAMSLDCVLLGLFAAWWLWVLHRSGCRYAGPPEGP
ncbi:MAG: hypothetical protein JSV78_03860, partial [Phycisphaerales bacterium]